MQISDLRSLVLEPYTTTVVGAFSVPRWYEALEKQVEAGSLSQEDMADAQHRATQAAIADQEDAGIDVVNGGEMHRRTNNRYAPPNAMLNHFWARIPGFSAETRPKPITPKDENVTHPAAVLTGPVRYGDLGLVDEFRTVSRYAHTDVKVTMTGPHMLAKVAHDEHYGGDLTPFMNDLAEVLNRNFRELQEAGCRHVQVDEPLFGAVDRPEVEAAVEAINAAFEGITMTRWVHICQGNYAVGEDYDGQIGHRYFDYGEYPADLIAGIGCDALMVEYDVAEAYRGQLREQQLAIGAADVTNPEVEPTDVVVERVQAQSWLPREQTLLTSTCGLNHLPRDVATAKLRTLSEAQTRLRG